MTMNTDGVVERFNIFKNQFICMSVIKNLESIDPFSFKNSQIYPRSPEDPQNTFAATNVSTEYLVEVSLLSYPSISLILCGPCI